MPTALETIDRSALFESLDAKTRKQLAADMSERRFAAGEEMSTEDRGGVGFFLIAEGTASVSVKGTPKGQLLPGMHYGEMALLTGGTRGATILADTEVQCWVLSQWHFKPLVQNNPEIAWKLLQELAQRVRAYQAAA
jgi:CRP-like cAMP-binding protein